MLGLGLFAMSVILLIVLWSIWGYCNGESTKASWCPNMYGTWVSAIVFSVIAGLGLLWVVILGLFVHRHRGMIGGLAEGAVELPGKVLRRVRRGGGRSSSSSHRGGKHHHHHR